MFKMVLDKKKNVFGSFSHVNGDIFVIDWEEKMSIFDDV